MINYDATTYGKVYDICRYRTEVLSCKVGLSILNQYTRRLKMSTNKS